MKIKKIIDLSDNLIKAYKKGNNNYYILSNLKVLSSEIEKNNYFNNIDYSQLSKYIDDIVSINISIDKNFGFKNMWISEKYCKNWGFKEAIREFIQNQHDGIITKINSKENILVKGIGPKFKINGISKYLDFDIMNKNDLKIYGKIRYDKENEYLSISNEGQLFLGDFLFGNSKEELNNPDIIGKYGEGMKLAILALCRIEKDVTIFSSNKKYTFTFKEDENLLQNDQPQKCLHIKIEDSKEKEKDQIIVNIQNVSEIEWNE